MYGVALFLHVLGAVLLFVAIAIELLCAVNMLRARRVEHLRMWSQAQAVIERLFPVATVLLIGAGIWLTVTTFSFRTPFVIVGLTGLIIIAAESQVVQGKLWKTVHAETASAADGPVPAELAAQIARPAVWSSMIGGTGGAVGALVIMTNKPGWIVSIAIVVVLSAIGAALGPSIVRSRQPSAAVAPPKTA